MALLVSDLYSTLAATASAAPPWVWPLLALPTLACAGLLGQLWRLQRQLRHLGPTQTPAAAPPAADGLVSREHLERALDAAEARCDRKVGAFALLCISVDNLEAINDGYGHRQADALIAEATRRMRRQGGPQAPLARLGGVEFALLLPSADLDQACALAGRLCDALARPAYPVPGRADATLSCSVGLAVYPQHGSRRRLLSHASLAMRQVKQAGGADYAVFDPRIAIDRREQAELLADLRLAVDRGQLELFYQPKVDARSLQITAAEALLRWHHPQRGMISPAVFIPLAERHGLIVAIGNWVIDETARQAAAWRACGLRMRVAINISACQMRQDDLVDRIEAALLCHRLQAGRFTCEITESVAMEDTRVTQRSFERMRKAGLHVSIDDFGVGQASLSYLRRLPAAELKIDASFVKDLENSADARAIVLAVVELAHALNLRVVAEGVETARQRDLLVQTGCDELQGYLFARPMTAKSLTAWALMDDDRLYHQQGADFRDSLFQETRPGDDLGPAAPAEPVPVRRSRAQAGTEGSPESAIASSSSL